MSGLQHWLREYYAAQTPTAETANRLVGLAQAASTSRARIWKSSLFLGALAAAIGVAAIVPAYQLGYRAGLAQTHTPSPPPPEPLSIDARPTASVPPAARSIEPRLVLLRVHADWCPRCPSIKPIYEELTRSYANEPIVFATLDITSPATRRQARYLAESLGVFHLLGEKYEPGMLRLFDRSTGELVFDLRENSELSRFQQALAAHLPRAKSHN